MNYFANELKAEWALMRQGRFTLDNLMKYVIQNQIDVIPAKYYNDDAQVKYLDFGSLYTYCCHGNKELLVKRWLRERIAYVDSMMGYFTSQDDQVTIRMNKTGRVEFTVTPYIPLYFSVKWSNAEGGTQTFKLKRGETKTFYYTSTTATDQEVIIYHAQYIKDLGNLSNLRPSSCILANAYKLNNIEIHSDELYNINVTANRYLRRLDLSGCTTLGTVTATGSVLDVSNCKYLSYLNIDNTALTGVLLNTDGGSLKEIYYPKSIQEVKLIKQTLLETVGLTYGNNGEDIPTSLYTVDIQECPNIKTLNTSSDSEINKTWISMKYCQNLTVRNSLDYEQITLDGFQRLKILKLENMFKLKALGFDNMLVKGEKSTLQYMGVSYCPALEHITMNCTSNDYEITFANGALLNLGGATSLKSISSNCVIHGLETIVLPLSVEHLFFTNEYGEGYSSIKNIWSSRCCEINEEGILPVAIRYSNPDFVGMDLEGMKLKDIDLGALVNIPDAINFYLTPTSVNPNFNINRDGVEYPYLQPKGLLDLSNYTESLARFFNGVDLEKLVVMVDNPLPQQDLSYCFYNSIFTKDSQISPILDNLDTITNMEYCFYKTSVKDVSILNNINFLAGTSMKHCFAECANISELKDIALSGNIGDASYMFAGCGVSTIDNVSTSCNNIIGMFSNCPNLTSVTNFNASGTTSYESLFEGCTGMAVAPITSIPTSIVNIKNMYKNCDSLVSIDGFVLHGNITEVTGFIEGCDKLVNANNVTISGSFYNDIFRGVTSLKYVNNLLINYVGRSMTFANMFDGCTNLEEMSFHDDSYVKDVISMDYMFRGTSMRTVDFSNVNFEKVSSYRYMFADCLMEEFSYTVPETIISIEGFLNGCNNLKTLRNFYIDSNVSTNKWIDNTSIENLINCRFNTQFTTFENYTSLKNVENLTYTGKDFSNYFKGCTSLENATVNITNNATKAENTFANCTNLVSVDFTESDLSNISSISGMFASDTSLNTINNLKITNDLTIANNTTLGGCPIINTDGLYINSNDALDMFRMGENSNIVRFTDFELGSNANDLHELFANYPHLTHDILIPSHIETVQKMFYNCISLEYITSNWSNRYDLNVDSDPNNDIITEQCYSECNNIRYIDNELYMNEYGELTAIYTIPEEWGGVANYEPNQTAFYINTELLTDNTITLNGSNGTYITDWGDGTKDKRVSHTYTKNGSFRIVTDNTETFGTGQAIPENFRTAITKVVHLDEGITNGANLFKGCSNLLSLKPLTNTFNMVHSMFENCGKIVNIDLSQCTISNSCIYMYNMFKYCSNLETVKLPDIPTSVINLQECFCDCESLTSVTPLQIPDACTNISYLFANSGITDISGFTFGSGIKNSNSWTPPNLTTANNVTIKNNNIKFKSCSTLIECNNLTFTDEVTTIADMFNNCINLNSVENLILGEYCNNLSRTFDNCTSLERLVIPELPSDRDIAFYRTFASCGKLKYLEFYDKVMTVTVSPSDINVQTMNDCNNLVTLKNFKVKYADKNVTSDILQTYINTEAPALNILAGLYTFFGNCRSLKETPGMGIYNNSARLLFYNFQGDITDFIIGEEVTNISYLFRNKPRLTHDIEIPSHITDCTSCFKNSTKITHIHSNWDNEYDNEITATDCYTGCNAITHIDGENVIAYEGDNGLDYVPLDWGGNGFTKDYTMILEVEIPSDNYVAGIVRGTAYTTLPNNTAKVSWGDGSNAELIIQNSSVVTHTYSKAGTYVIKAHAHHHDVMQHANLTPNITKLLQIPRLKNGTPINNFSNTFMNCKKLVYADLSNLEVANNSFRTFNTFNSCSSLETVILPENMVINYSASMFSGCGKLTSIVNYETWDMTKCAHANSMFNGCGSLGNLDVSNWGMGGIAVHQGWGVDYMFYNCKKMDYFDVSKWNTSTWNSCSSLFTGTSIETIDLSNWQPLTKGTSTNKHLNYMFAGCTKLKEIIGLESILDSNINGISYIFQNCTSLPSSYLNSLGNYDLSNITDMGGVFSGCTQLTELDLSDCYIPKVKILGTLVQNCTNLTTLKFPPVQNYPDLYHVQGMLVNTPKLTRVENLPLVNYITQSKHESQMTCMLYAYGDRNQIPDNGLTFTFVDKITSLWNIWSGVYVPNMFNKFTSEGLNNIVNALYDYASEGSTKTLNTNGYISRFTNEQLTTATNKGWTIT